MDKSLLRQSLLAALQEELDRLTRAAHLAREEATDAESKAENKYDTRGQEAAYLAEGQARIATELHETITAYTTLPLPDFTPGQPLGLGAVVTLEMRGKSTHYLLGPRSGGLEIEIDGLPLVVVTPPSPLGRELYGRKSGDTFELLSRGIKSRYRIANVA